LSDIAARMTWFPRGLSGSFTLSDAITRTGTVGRTASETVTVTVPSIAHDGYVIPYTATVQVGAGTTDVNGYINLNITTPVVAGTNDYILIVLAVLMVTVIAVPILRRKQQPD